MSKIPNFLDYRFFISLLLLAIITPAFFVSDSDLILKAANSGDLRYCRKIKTHFYLKNCVETYLHNNKVDCLKSQLSQYCLDQQMLLNQEVQPLLQMASPLYFLSYVLTALLSVLGLYRFEDWRRPF